MPYPNGGSFAALFDWHLLYGTRPEGTPNLPGKRWSNKEFAGEFGNDERSIRNWRTGRFVPDDLGTIERILFGDNAAYADWRFDLRRAYDGKAAIPAPFDRAARIESPPPYFLGREPDVAAILTALRASRDRAAILVHGGPGMGKTTLTQAVALHAEIIQRFGEDRRWFARLETATTAEAMKDAIIRAIGRDPGQGWAAALAALRAAPGLLVLDNLETPWDPIAKRRATEAALAELNAIPGLAVLASFRGRDRVGGADWALIHAVTALSDAAATDLFQRVAERDFAGDPHLALFIQALGGIPLAIDLVAHRADSATSLAALWRQWERIGAGLAAHPDYDRDRLTSLPASIELSLASSRMTPASHRLFRLLGQLPAGLAEEDRDALLGDAGYDAAERLLRIGLAVDRAGRLDLLPPIRDHAARNHRPHPPDDAAWRDHYLILTRLRGEAISTKAGEGAVARLLPELPNIESAIRAALAVGRREDAMASRNGLYRLTYIASAPTPVFAELAAACRAVGDLLGEANCIESLGDIALARSDHERARKAYDDAIPLYKQVGDLLGEANCIQSLGDIALRRSDHERARKAYEDAIPLYKQVGSLLGEANCIQSLGDIALRRSDHERARKAYEDAIPLYKQVGDLLGEANCIKSLAESWLRRVTRRQGRSGSCGRSTCTAAFPSRIQSDGHMSASPGSRKARSAPRMCGRRERLGPALTGRIWWRGWIGNSGDEREAMADPPKVVRNGTQTLPGLNPP